MRDVFEESLEGETDGRKRTKVGEMSGREGVSMANGGFEKDRSVLAESDRFEVLELGAYAAHRFFWCCW